MDLGYSSRSRLPRPSASQSFTPSIATSVPKKVASRLTEVTFKTIAEEYAAEHNLLFIPTGKVHVKSRIPMYRVTGRTDGKGGIVVYILDDVVWLVDGGAEAGTVKGINLEEMVLLATKAK